jgi:hypothetical protein
MKFKMLELGRDWHVLVHVMCFRSSTCPRQAEQKRPHHTGLACSAHHYSLRQGFTIALANVMMLAYTNILERFGSAIA